MTTTKTGIDSSRSATRAALLLGLAGSLLGTITCLAAIPTDDESVDATPMVETAASSPVIRPLQDGMYLVRRSRQHGIYGAPVGRRFEFGYGANIDSRAVSQTIANDAAQDASLTCSGDMVLQVVKRDADTVVAHVAFAGLRIDGSVGGRSDLDEFVATARRGCFVHYSVDGQVTGYSFPRGVDHDGRALLRLLIGPLAFVANESEASWRTREADGIGVCDIAYERIADDGTTLSIARCKDSYTKLSSSLPSGTKQSVEAKAHATLDRQTGWLRDAEIDERLAFDVPQVGGIHFALHATLNFRGVSNGPRMDLTDLADPANLADADAAADFAAAQANARCDFMRHKIGDLTIDAALRTLCFAAAEDDNRKALVDAWQQLTLLLELEPQHAAVVATAARDPRTSPAAANALFAALGAAGHAGAQHLLAGALRDGRLAADRRCYAAAALIQVRTPTAAVLGALESAMGNLDRTDDVAATSLLTYGALAERSTTTATMQRLVAMEAKAQAAGSLSLWLEAVGNAGAAADSARERILHHTRSAKAQVRHAAASALRTIKNATSRDALGRLATTDSDPSVRAQAIASLAEHGPVARQLLEAIATRESDSRVRGEAQRALARIRS